MRREREPPLAAVLTQPETPRRRSEGEPVTGAVDVERMAIDEVVRVLLREPFAQGFEALSTVASPIDHDCAVHRDPELILGRGHEPRGLRVVRMHGHSESELRGRDILDRSPVAARIG